MQPLLSIVVADQEIASEELPVLVDHHVPRLLAPHLVPLVAVVVVALEVAAVPADLLHQPKNRKVKKKKIKKLQNMSLKRNLQSLPPKKLQLQIKHLLHHHHHHLHKYRHSNSNNNNNNNSSNNNNNNNRNIHLLKIMLFPNLLRKKMTDHCQK